MPRTIKRGMGLAHTTAAELTMSQAETITPPPPAKHPGRWSWWALASVYGVLLGLLALFSHHYWLSADQGRHKLQALQQAVQAQQAQNAEIAQRNADMAELLDRLKLDYPALEEHARYDLGMIRRGETFIRLLDADDR